VGRLDEVAAARNMDLVYSERPARHSQAQCAGEGG